MKPVATAALYIGTGLATLTAGFLLGRRSVAVKSSLPATGPKTGDTIAAKAGSARVRQAQVALRALSYYTGAVDGQLGAQTAQAIALFQSDHVLPTTGTLTPTTISDLDEAYRVLQQPEASPPAPREVVTRFYQELNALGYNAGDVQYYESPDLLGAVHRFQALEPQEGLAFTDRLDAPTKAAIDRVYQARIVEHAEV